jgi:hypothetical protein
MAGGLVVSVLSRFLSLASDKCLGVLACLNSDSPGGDMPDQHLKISSAGDKRPGARRSGSSAEAPCAENGKVWPESVSSDPASGMFLRFQSLDDAISFREARVAAPCPDCGPGAVDGRCDDHARDLSLLAGYRKLAEKEIAEIQIQIEKTRGRKAAAAPPPGHAA